jgi:hypothetical protein
MGSILELLKCAGFAPATILRLSHILASTAVEVSSASSNLKTRHAPNEGPSPATDHYLPSQTPNARPRRRDALGIANVRLLPRNSRRKPNSEFALR